MEIYDDIFTDMDFGEILHKVSQPKWQYGHGSNQGKNVLPFWMMDLSDDEFFSDYLLNMIFSK